MKPRDDPPPDGGPALPASPEQRFMRWAGLLFGINVLCLLMLAARAASPIHMRGFFDIAIFACILGVASFAIVRLMFLYPFRLADLLVMVIVLSLGMKGAIEAADAMRRSQWGWVFSQPSSMNASYMNYAPEAARYVLYAETCMVTACVLMGGAALGLRHCRLLEIKAPFARGMTLLYGMTVLPAGAGLVGIPFYLFYKLMTEKQTSAEALGWVAAFLFSFFATVSNTSMALKSLALRTQNSAQEGKWREK